MARPLKHMHGLRIRTLVLPSRSKKRMPTWRYSEFLTNLKRILCGGPSSSARELVWRHAETHVARSPVRIACFSTIFSIWTVCRAAPMCIIACERPERLSVSAGVSDLDVQLGRGR